MKMNSKYLWGDVIHLSKHAPPECRPDTLAEIVGIFIIETPEQSKLHNHEVGTALYVVEFGDGSSIQVPEDYIAGRASEG